MRLRRRAEDAPRVPAATRDRAGVRPRDLLAAAYAEGSGWLLATRRSLLLVPDDEDGAVGRTDWIDVDLLDWTSDDDRLTVVPSDAAADPVTVVLREPGDVLAVLRERVTSTVVLERHAGTPEGPLTVVCRRASVSDDLVWRVRYAEGVDADDPTVRRVAARTLAQARDELGG